LGEIKMTENSFAVDLEKRIEAEYRRRGDALGWRFLASPANVLDGARVAFIGLNPAGKHDRKDHPRFAMDRGSAYVDEVWEQNKLAGDSKLQVQVRSLFFRLGEKPGDVLAGQLVPFRSPRESELRSHSDAVRFGAGLWREVLPRSRPHIVVAMGNTPILEIRKILGVREIVSYPLDWGKVSAKRGRFRRWDGSEGTFIGLPHLSTFSVIERPNNRGQAEISRLLEGLGRNGAVVR
jgi:hypothetical protein